MKLIPDERAAMHFANMRKVTNGEQLPRRYAVKTYGTKTSSNGCSFTKNLPPRTKFDHRAEIERKQEEAEDRRQSLK